MRPAVIIGSAGQDGRILSAQLTALGRPVVGFDAHGGEPLALEQPTKVAEVIKQLSPWAVFYLAAVHRSAEAKEENPLELFKASNALHVDGAVAVLDALKHHCPDGRFFYAASSHVFGVPDKEPQDETTPFRPLTPYAITKAAGVQATSFYRRNGLHASSGILYNHESPLRPPGFLTKKVILAAKEAAKAKREGRDYLLELGSLTDVVDWSWAADVTLAMRLIVEANEPGDYVVASGEPHSVDELCKLAFANAGLDHKQHVRERPGTLTRRSPRLIGDSGKLRRETGWRSTLTFEQMVSRLAEETPDVR